MDALQNFFYMGGYAFHVWTSYGLAFVLLSALFIAPFQRKTNILKTLARRSRRQL